jgi:hypothetical protein
VWAKFGTIPIKKEGYYLPTSIRRKDRNKSIAVKIQVKLIPRNLLKPIGL